MVHVNRLRFASRAPALAALAITAMIAVASVGAQGRPILVLGGGSTFVAPLFAAWTAAFQATDATPRPSERRRRQG